MLLVANTHILLVKVTFISPSFTFHWGSRISRVQCNTGQTLISIICMLMSNSRLNKGQQWLTKYTVFTFQHTMHQVHSYLTCMLTYCIYSSKTFFTFWLLK